MTYTLIALLIFSVHAIAQKGSNADSNLIRSLNQQLDDLVVSKNVTALAPMYADDFVFNHGSGKTEGIAGWLTTVGRANYPKRLHDSVVVEMHNGIAVVRGKMNIEKVNKDKTDRYWLKYVRVFAYRKGWVLVSHTTVAEAHEL